MTTHVHKITIITCRHGQTSVQIFSLTSTREFQVAKYLSRYIHTRPSRIIHLSTLIANTMAHIKSAATFLLLTAYFSSNNFLHPCQAPE